MSHQNYLGLAGLLRRNLAGEDLTPILQALIQQANEDPNDADSLMDAAIIFQFYGDKNLALQLQQEALKLTRHFCIPASQPANLRLLALMAPGDLMANVPIECLLENSDIELHSYYATQDSFDPTSIPDHDLVFVAMSESEQNRPLIEFWTPLLTHWPLPVLNAPQNIHRVARDTASLLLHALPGVVMPLTYKLTRQQLQQFIDNVSDRSLLPNDLQFPLIIRPLDSHAGNDLYKIDSKIALQEKINSIAEDVFFVSAFIDYSSADGMFRKYRIVIIEGKPFACHMGISEHWMIHYLNAGMAESPEKRAEEAQFMADFEKVFAVKHATALTAIFDTIGLDYLGIDCAETRDGRLLIFEVEHAMIAHAMDPVDVYPYKQATLQKLFDAFRTMLIKTVEQSRVFSEIS